MYSRKLLPSILEGWAENMVWSFDFLPTSCTSGQHSFFKRPTWGRRVFSPKETCNFPPPSVLFLPGSPRPHPVPARSRTLGVCRAVPGGTGPRCQVALPGWGRTGSGFTLKHRCIFSPHSGTQKAPGVSPRNVPRSADPGQVLGALSLPTTKLLPAERGPAWEGKVPWKGCQGQTFPDSFLLLGPRYSFGGGACAPKVWG